MNIKALIFDRDGTIIYNKHYLSDPKKVELIPGSKEAFQLLKHSKLLLFLHTNQSGVSRKLMSKEDVILVNKQMFKLLEIEESCFQRICISYEKEFSEINYRKPSLKLINEICRDYDITYRNIAYVGDSMCELEISLKTGCTFYEIRADDKPPLTNKFYNSIYELPFFKENF